MEYDELSAVIEAVIDSNTIFAGNRGCGTILQTSSEKVAGDVIKALTKLGCFGSPIIISIEMVTEILRDHPSVNENDFLLSDIDKLAHWFYENFSPWVGLAGNAEGKQQ